MDPRIKPQPIEKKKHTHKQQIVYIGKQTAREIYLMCCVFFIAVKLKSVTLFSLRAYSIPC